MSFQKKLLFGDFVVLAEFDPPKGVDVSDLFSNIIRVKGRVDGVIVPEMARNGAGRHENERLGWRCPDGAERNGNHYADLFPGQKQACPSG